MYYGIRKHSYFSAERIKLFLECLAFLRSYDLAPRPPTPLNPLSNKFPLFLSFFLCVAGPAYWKERSRGAGRGTESYDRRKAYSRFNISSSKRQQTVSWELNYLGPKQALFCRKYPRRRLNGDVGIKHLNMSHRVAGLRFPFLIHFLLEKHANPSIRTLYCLLTNLF